MTDDDYEEIDIAEASPPDEDYEEPALVAQSEADMLTMARALVGGPAAQDDIWALLCAPRKMPPKIGPTCADLLEDTLCHAWAALWQRGGAAPDASIRNGAVVRGRLWERHDTPVLPFTAAAVDLLRWLAGVSFAAPASTIPELPKRELALGDQVLVYLALDAAKATPALRVIAAQPFVRACPLAWLAFPASFAGKTPVPAFDSLVTGVGAIVVEALRLELGKRWHAGELTKRAMTDPDQLIALGATQDAVLEGFMAAASKAGRRDLCTFVLDAAAPLLARNLSPQPGVLDSSATLANRAKARIAAGALARAVVRWGEWDQQHRGIRFIDDDYAAAQLLLERFEPIGASGVTRAQVWLSDLAALAPTPEPPPSQDAARANIGGQP